MANTPTSHEVQPIPTEPVRNIKIGFAERDTEDTPTKASSSFLERSLARVGFGVNVIAGVIYGSGVVNEIILHGDQGKIVLGAIVTGISIAGAAVSRQVLK